MDHRYDARFANDKLPGIGGQFGAAEIVCHQELEVSIIAGLNMSSRFMLIMAALAHPGPQDRLPVSLRPPWAMLPV